MTEKQHMSRDDQKSFQEACACAYEKLSKHEQVTIDIQVDKLVSGIKRLHSGHIPPMFGPECALEVIAKLGILLSKSGPPGDKGKSE